MVFSPLRLRQEGLLFSTTSCMVRQSKSSKPLRTSRQRVSCIMRMQREVTTSTGTIWLSCIKMWMGRPVSAGKLLSMIFLKTPSRGPGCRRASSMSLKSIRLSQETLWTQNLSSQCKIFRVPSQPNLATVVIPSPHKGFQMEPLATIITLSKNPFSITKKLSSTQKTMRRR